MYFKGVKVFKENNYSMSLIKDLNIALYDEQLSLEIELKHVRNKVEVATL